MKLIYKIHPQQKKQHYKYRNQIRAADVLFVWWVYGTHGTEPETDEVGGQMSSKWNNFKYESENK